MEKEKKNEKQAYEPPKATFVALKVEERLLACSKITVPNGCFLGLLSES